jgi:hypothetical protein
MKENDTSNETENKRNEELGQEKRVRMTREMREHGMRLKWGMG